jgi:hypothetical protein
MKVRTLMTIVALCSMSGMAMAQDHKAPAKPEMKPVQPAKPADAKPADAHAGGMGDAEKKMMEAWAAASTPGEMHKLMAGRIGEWDMAVESMNPMEPGKSEKSGGTTVSKAIMGGRFVVSEIKSTMMGMPFEGMEICGYNNVSKKFESSWIDSMGTGIYNSTGTYDEKAKQITYVGEMDDPTTGKKSKARGVVTIKDHDHHTFEMFGAGPDGKEMKMISISYTRKGASAETTKDAAKHVEKAVEHAADKAKDAVKDLPKGK